MEALLITCGLVPFLAGRTTLAVGLILTGYTIETAVSTGEFSWKTVLLAAACTVLSIVSQVLVAWLRSALEALTETYRWVMRQADTAFSVAMTMSVAAALLDLAAGHAKSAISQGAVLILGVGVLAFAFSQVRSRLGEVAEVLPLTSSIRRTAFVTELLWTAAGVAIAMAFPLVGAVLMVLALAGLLAATLVLVRVRDTSRGPCASCGSSLHLSASQCPSCKAPRNASGFQFLGRAAGDAGPKHRFALLGARRCPSCAEQISSHACGAPLFADETESRTFVKYVDARAAAMAPLFALLGFVPFLGLGAAVLVYRMSAASALAAHVTVTGRIGNRALKGAGMLGLSLLQPVPLVGAAATVGVITAMHVWTRQAFLRRVEPLTAKTERPALS